MGTRFRKSLNLGPLRINFSQSGVGFSVGNKFGRITQKADGNIRTTTTLPGTGISHVEEIKAAPKQQAPAAQRNSNYEELQKRREETLRSLSCAVFDENEDGVRRQTLLRKIKENRPPFDKERVVSIAEVDGSEPPLFFVTVNGCVVGTVPPKAAASIAEKWERIDCISAFEPFGRSTAHDYYGAQVYVRFFAENTEE